MSKEDFLKRLEEALAGSVPASVVRENLSYYSNYITQETAKGRTVENIVEEIGDPRLIGRTIIDSCEAAGETVNQEGGYSSVREEGPVPHIKYVDLNKWYWKLLLIVICFSVLFMVFGLVGGIFTLLIRFAGPIFVILMVYWFIKNLRK